MKVYREVRMKTGRIKLGDRIKVKMMGEQHTATAIQRVDDEVLFVFDECLNKTWAMNEKGTTEGGYERSLMRVRLAIAATMITKKLREKLVPDENGDLLWLLSEREVFGLEEDDGEVEGQIEYFRDEKNRVATVKGVTYPWWLRDVASGTHFAVVTYDGGYGDSCASNPRGVRPVFKIRDLAARMPAILRQ